MNLKQTPSYFRFSSKLFTFIQNVFDRIRLLGIFIGIFLSPLFILLVPLDILSVLYSSTKSYFSRHVQMTKTHSEISNTDAPTAQNSIDITSDSAQTVEPSAHKKEPVQPSNKSDSEIVDLVSNTMEKITMAVQQTLSMSTAHAQLQPVSAATVGRGETAPTTPNTSAAAPVTSPVDLENVLPPYIYQEIVDLHTKVVKKNITNEEIQQLDAPRVIQRLQKTIDGIPSSDAAAENLKMAITRLSQEIIAKITPEASTTTAHTPLQSVSSHEVGTIQSEIPHAPATSAAAPEGSADVLQPYTNAELLYLHQEVLKDMTKEQLHQLDIPSVIQRLQKTIDGIPSSKAAAENLKKACIGSLDFFNRSELYTKFYGWSDAKSHHPVQHFVISCILSAALINEHATQRTNIFFKWCYNLDSIGTDDAHETLLQHIFKQSLTSFFGNSSNDSPNTYGIHTDYHRALIKALSQATHERTSNYGAKWSTEPQDTTTKLMYKSLIHAIVTFETEDSYHYMTPQALLGLWAFPLMTQYNKGVPLAKVMRDPDYQTMANNFRDSISTMHGGILHSLSMLASPKNLYEQLPPSFSQKVEHDDIVVYGKCLAAIWDCKMETIHLEDTPGVTFTQEFIIKTFFTDPESGPSRSFASDSTNTPGQADIQLEINDKMVQNRHWQGRSLLKLKNSFKQYLVSISDSARRSTISFAEDGTSTYTADQKDSTLNQHTDAENLNPQRP